MQLPAIRTLLLVMALWAGIAADASAEGEKPDRGLLVLPLTRNGDRLDRLAEVAADVDDALATREARRIPYRSAAAEFLERHSRDPAPVTQHDLDALHTEGGLAVRAAALGQLQEALRHVQQVRARVDRVLETLHRDLDEASEYVSVCAGVVRALVASGDLAAAKDTARKCQATVPDLDPTEADAPERVRQLFAEVKKEALSQGTSTLHVESEPAGCDVFIQGRKLSTTPYSFRGMVGQQYRLQVECGEALPGRVHTVKLGPTPRTEVVDTVFEAAVQTSGGLLWLSYAHPTDPTTRDHATKVGEALGARRVIVVSSAGKGHLELRMVADDDGQPVPLREPYTRKQLDEALDEVLTRSSPDGIGSTVTSEGEGVVLDAPRDDEAVARARGHRRVLLSVGTTLTVLGGVAAGFSAWRFQQWRKDGVALRSVPTATADEFAADQREWLGGRTTPLALGSTAIVLGTVGAAVLAPTVPTSMRPWVSPVATVLGAGLVIGGAVQIAQGQNCATPSPRPELSACIGGQEQHDRGVLLLAGALPLLAMPVVHLIDWTRRRARRQADVAVVASSRHLQLSVRF